MNKTPCRACFLLL